MVCRWLIFFLLHLLINLIFCYYLIYLDISRKESRYFICIKVVVCKIVVVVCSCTKSVSLWDLSYIAAIAVNRSTYSMNHRLPVKFYYKPTPVSACSLSRILHSEQIEYYHANYPALLLLKSGR